MEASSVRWRTRVGQLIMGTALALLIPSVALAATTSFSARIPGSGASTTATRPTISVIGYDSEGAHGSGAFKMTVDGRSVTPSVTYIVTGTWNPTRPDYRRFKLSYRPGSALAVGSHRVSVTVRDLKRRSASTSWTIKVVSTTPPVEETTPTVTFSSFAPASGAVTFESRPTIALNVYESFGVKGIGSYTMTIDGRSVAAVISYTTSGDYRRFKLSYRPIAVMDNGVHIASVALTDLKGKTASTSWSFMTQGSAVVYESMPAPAMSACTSCHTDYPGSHPMTACQACHGASSPARVNGSPMTSYTGADLSAHTVSCAAESCHGGGGTFPHVLDADCGRCHSAAYADIPAAHTGSLDEIHISATGPCTGAGCHVSSLTTEHYRHTIDGARLDCQTCHASTDPAVIAAIKTHTTSCTACHVIDSATHSVAATPHAVSNSCVGGSCHPTEASSIHNGKCNACHASGTFPSTTCSSCHAAGSYHAAAAGAHTAPSGGCVAAGCHGQDAAAIHTATGGPGCLACHGTGKTPSTTCSSCHAGDPHPTTSIKHTTTSGTCVNSTCHPANVATIHAAVGCVACHATGKTPSTNCVLCHQGSVASLHSASSAKHVAAGGTCVSASCHVSDVAAVHVSGPSCAACHAAGKTPSTTCSTCHAGDVASLHASAAGKHTAPEGTCVGTGCHVTNVLDIHATGPGCAACHAAGKTPSTTCSTCHAGDVTSLHASAETSHTAPLSISCTAEGCHTRNVATLHAPGPGCAACHGPGKTPSSTCATCHIGDAKTIHGTIAGTRHTAPDSTCVTGGCHDSNVVGLHENGPNCAACHAAGKTPSTTCTLCHTTDLVTLHASAETSHTAPSSTCVTAGCHAANVANVHANGPGCAACHATGKIPSTVCTSCHSGDLLTLHSRADAAHTAPRGTCVNTGCHGDNAAFLHSAGPGCAACHAAGKTPSTTCSTCHLTDTAVVHVKGDAHHAADGGTCVNTTCHDTNVVLVHSLGPNCVACHAVGKTPSTTCAACHPGDIAELHAAADLAHDAPVSTCVSSKCHVTNVSAIHAPGPGCAACHKAGKVATMQCVTCHGGDLTSRHPTAQVPHTSPVISCISSTCHSTNIATIHAGGPGCAACHAPGVTPSEICSFCHPTDYATVHAKSFSSHVVPLGQCIRSGCHAGNVGTIHEKSTRSCSACHGAGIMPSLTCATCHTGDARTVHPTFDTVHAAPANSCTGTGCHQRSVSWVHAYPGPSYTGTAPGCAACHNGTSVPTKDCKVCHTPGFPPTHPAPLDKHNASAVGCVISTCHGSDVTKLHAPGPACSACHAATATPSLACASCHTGNVGTRHTTVPAGAHDGVGTCVSTGCHASNVTAVHVKSGTARCQACHIANIDPKVKGTTCANCHNASLDHTTSHQQCNDCHRAYVSCHCDGHQMNGPTVGKSDCSTCHSSDTYVHPATCHGCEQGVVFHPSPFAAPR